MRILTLITLLFLAATAAGQTMAAGSSAAKAPADAAATPSGPPALRPASLRSDGLNFDDDLLQICAGDFARVGFARANPWSA